MEHIKVSIRSIIIGTLLMGWILGAVAPASAGAEFTQGQTVYVGAYSHILIGDKARPFDLSVTLCIRNTDLHHAITVISADYHDAQGTRVKSLLGSPLSVRPLATTHFFVTRSDESGGLSPSFVVKWKSATKVSEPIIEAVMIGDRSGQGISFITRGRPVRDTPE